jgi:O-antigen/teichoic acid export membrane protein
MFSGLIKSAAISVIAFFAVSVVGLLIVPVLISSYGLAGFGLITIGRLFLPTSALAVFDLGYGEIAINSVATSRVTGDWGRCARLLSLNLLVAWSIGMLACIVLLALAPLVLVSFTIPAVHQDEMNEVLRVTAVLLPVLFCSLVAEGILKGFESFGLQRLLEVLSALAYAGGCLLAVDYGLDFRWVCYALLGSLLLRAGLAVSFAARALRSNRVTLARWTHSERSDFILRARGLFQSKLLGVAQVHSPSLLVTILFGPVALGTFEALSRMARFTKAVLGVLSSTVQPVAARLGQLADERGLTRLGHLGLILVASIAAPVLGLSLAFSEPLLRLWLGSDFSALWYWQAFYFIVPTLGVLVSFVGSALIGRMSVVADMNPVSLVNVSVLVVLGLVLTPWLSEKAFFVSQVIATLVSVPWHLRIVSRVIGLQSSTFARVASIYVIALILALPVALFAYRIDAWAHLIGSMAVWGITCWMVCLWLGLPAPLRTRAFSTIAGKLRARY